MMNDITVPSLFFAKITVPFSEFVFCSIVISWGVRTKRLSFPPPLIHNLVRTAYRVSQLFNETT